MTPLGWLAVVAGGAAAWEGAWWAHRRARRGQVYRHAQRVAAQLGRPLVVIGAPDSGPTAGYGCGDVTVDIAAGSSCPRYVRADVTKPLPFADASCVVFCSCVLEYVHDALAAVREIQRVSGGYCYFVGVEPHTLTAYLYPGARRTLPTHLR